MLIGITYDLQEDYLAGGMSAEDAAEFDRRDTIDAIAAALTRHGHTPDPIGNLDALIHRLQAGERWDLVFNIAEGLHGFAREAQVPALLDAYRIPYTFSDAMTLALCLHKGMCKRIVRDGGVPTPDFAVLETASASDALELPFPLFVKPVAEGTGKGVSGVSKVTDHAALKRACEILIERFHQPVLVETYLPGREFTVGVVGTGDAARTIGVMEVIFNQRAESANYSYKNKTDWIGKLEYRVPENAVSAECSAVALAAWRILGCRDAGRVDLRLDTLGRAHFIEVNPLAGINPEISDLSILCGLHDIRYECFIGWILDSAESRLNKRNRASTASIPDARPLAAILYGAVTADAGADEQDTLAEVRAVSEALTALGYRVERVEMTLNLERVRTRLEALKPTYVFNLVSSIGGDDRYQHLAPTLLESLNLAYTGAPLTTMLCTTNKLAVKQSLRLHGLATPDWHIASSSASKENAGFWIIKSTWLHASAGLDDNSVVSGTRVDNALNQRGATDWFAECYIDGREINIAILETDAGPEVLPVAEITFHDFPPGKPLIIGYAAKWDPASFEYRHTFRRFVKSDESTLVDELKRLALACWECFGLRGYARVDFRIDAEGQPWILEVNTNPCLSPDAGFAAAAAEAGLDYKALIARIVVSAKTSSPSPIDQQQDASCSAYAASTT